LLIDDDAELCALLKEYFGREGHVLSFEQNGLRGLNRLRTESADLVILDVMLPGMDGFEVLRRLRELSKVPVLMLTARGDDVDRIVGLELGADDYLAKPFNPRELAARVRAILRRAAPRQEEEAAAIEVNSVRLDPAARTVEVRGHPVALTTIEFDILELLMRAAGRVLSRDAIMESLYGRKSTPFDRAVDMHVSHLRRKLESSDPLIKTVRGVGYQFLRKSGEAVL
jgi:two-component system response regulator CpxR